MPVEASVRNSIPACSRASRIAALHGLLRHLLADVIRRRVTTMTIEATERTGIGLGRGGRMSRNRKRDAVLRLLRGEDLEVLSRALGVTAATLSGWQDTFVAAGEASLATRPTTGDDLENERLKAKLGEMLLEREWTSPLGVEGVD